MKQWLNKTVLFTHACQEEDGKIQHGTVEQLSNSGKYVMIDWNWYDVEKVSILEEAPAKPAPQPVPVAQEVPVVQTSGGLEDKQSTAPVLVPGPFGGKPPEDAPFGRQQQQQQQQQPAPEPPAPVPTPAPEPAPEPPAPAAPVVPLPSRV